MAVNVSGEMALKQAIRGQIVGGANTWWSNPDYGMAVDAFDTNYGVKLVDFVPSGGVYTVSGTGNWTTAVTGTVGATSTVSGLVVSLNAVAPSGVVILSPRKATDLLTKTTTQLYVVAATGTAPTLTNVSGTTITSVTGNLATLSAAFPNYYGPGNAVPTWVDDATAHAYQLDGAGAIVVNSGLVVQKQVRQIKTDPAETMILDGYFIAYSGNNFQTQQKNTKQQQC